MGARVIAAQYARQMCIRDRDLEVLEQWLLKFDLKIVKKRNMGIGVAGGEFNIRQAILENNKEFMNEIYGSEQVPEGMDYRISEKFYNRCV